MKGQLTVVNNLPHVKADDGKNYQLGCCKLTKHTNGSWNFNMSIGSIYTAYKQGKKVSGSLVGNTFYAWSIE